MLTKFATHAKTRFFENYSSSLKRGPFPLSFYSTITFLLLKNKGSKSIIFRNYLDIVLNVTWMGILKSSQLFNIEDISNRVWTLTYRSFHHFLGKHSESLLHTYLVTRGLPSNSPIMVSRPLIFSLSISLPPSPNPNPGCKGFHLISLVFHGCHTWPITVKTAIPWCHSLMAFVKFPTHSGGFPHTSLMVLVFHSN